MTALAEDLARLPNPGGELVKAPEVAKFLGVSPLTVRRWIEDELIGGLEMRGRWYVFRSHYDALRAKMAAPPKPKAERVRARAKR